ncbi:MAG: phosphotransferase [Chloroflexota bacterium]|nr:MAG: phosphotransferase [Chloroflexota bacterium]
MKAYRDLTRRGQLRRLRKLAIKALQNYDLPVKWIKFFTLETNTMFKIRSEQGEDFVLRIYSDEETTLKENQTEIFWLNALLSDTDLRVTEPVSRRDGEYITVTSVPGVPGEKRCVLFRWIPGRELERQLTAGNYFKLGTVMAILHDHAESLKPLPRSIQPKKWDKVFYYPDEPVIYKSREYSQLFPPRRVDLIDQVIAKADEEFRRLYTDVNRQILIHGDLHYWNVHVYRGELYIMDFEDVMLAYPVQDIAITLYYGRSREDYAVLREAFQEGYTSLRNWPVDRVGQLETLMAARSVNFINYVARIDSSPEEYIEERCAELEVFLERYG